MSSAPTGKIIGLGGGILAIVIAAVAAVLVIVSVVVIGATSQVAGFAGAALLSQNKAGASSCAPPGTGGAIPVGSGNATLDAQQLANAKTIIGVGKSAFATTALQRQAGLVALMTAFQESTMRNLDGGDRDSVGLFQQRPSMGWGTSQQIQTPAYAAGRFYKALAGTAGWTGMAPGVAAQTVQISAFPDAYNKWQDESEALLVAYFDSTPAVPIPADVGFGGGATGGPGGDVIDVGCSIGSGELINPMVIGTYNISAVFGGRPAPCAGCSSDHKGIDMAGKCGTPIYAATSGTITSAGWGSGYGNVIVLTGSSLVTLYGHLQEGNPFNVKTGDTVKSGDLIGWMGTTGNSTGCHLHFETRIDGVQVDPMTQFELAGVQW